MLRMFWRKFRGNLAESISANGQLNQSRAGFWAGFVFCILLSTTAQADIVTGLVGWWKLDGGTSGDIANNGTVGLQDLSGKGNHGTAKNTNGTGMAWAAGRFSGGVNFDGVDDYIQVADSASLRLTSQGSIALWVKPNSLTQDTYAEFVSKDIGGGLTTVSYYFYWRYSQNQIRGGIVNDATSKYITMASPDDLNWHHMVFIWDESWLKLYKDGLSAVAPVAHSISAGSYASHPLKIGGNVFASPDGYLNGLIDDVRIYNRALSDDDVLQLYNNGGPTTIRKALIGNAVIR